MHTLQGNLYSLWHKIFRNNIETVDLFDLSINITYNNNVNGTSKVTRERAISANNPILIVSYLIKLDPRVSRQDQVISQIINTINDTLLVSDSNIYSNVTSNLGDTNSIAFVIPNYQISGKQVSRI